MRWFPLIFVSLTACEPATPMQTKTAEQQIAEALLAAPEPLRAGAAVLGYGSGGELTTLRERSGTSPLVCLADAPGDERFHVACYSESLEPYMRRGRQLRASGMDSGESIEQRQKEARDGTLEMPSHPAALYNLFAPEPPPSLEKGPDEAARLFVLYIPGATAEELGLPVGPSESEPGLPWLMYPGEPNSHLMISR